MRPILDTFSFLFWEFTWFYEGRRLTMLCCGKRQTVMMLTKKDKCRCSSALVGFWNFLGVKIFYSSIGCLCHHPQWRQPEHMELYSKQYDHIISILSGNFRRKYQFELWSVHSWWQWARIAQCHWERWHQLWRSDNHVRESRPVLGAGQPTILSIDIGICTLPYFCNLITLGHHT